MLAWLCWVGYVGWLGWVGWLVGYLAALFLSSLFCLF